MTLSFCCFSLFPSLLLFLLFSFLVFSCWDTNLNFQTRSQISSPSLENPAELTILTLTSPHLGSVLPPGSAPRGTIPIKYVENQIFLPFPDFFFPSFPRGHTVKAVCECFHLAKDAGFKVVAHMMPDLPNMGLERDMDQFYVSIPLKKKPKPSNFLFFFPFFYPWKTFFAQSKNTKFISKGQTILNSVFFKKR